MITATASSAAMSQPPTTRDYISHSQISTYQQCPLKYFFKYVAGIPEPTISASLRFGQAIHAAVEEHYRQLLSGGTPAGLDELLSAYQIAWDGEPGMGVTFGKGESADSLRDLAQRMLSAFLASHLASPTGTIVAIEEELRGKIIPGVPDALCRVDLIVATEQELIVTDLKTARTSWSSDQAQQAAGQLLLYYELTRELAGGKPVRLQFAVLTKTRQPSLQMVPVELAADRVTRTLKTVERVWQAIAVVHFYPCPSPMSCPGCPYREPCRNWQG